MTLYDQIIDEAEELSKLNILPRFATREMIVKAVSDACNTYIAPNSTAAHLAEACYNRAESFKQLTNAA